jgi:hypothetical protein
MMTKREDLQFHKLLAYAREVAEHADVVEAAARCDGALFEHMVFERFCNQVKHFDYILLPESEKP